MIIRETVDVARFRCTEILNPPLTIPIIGVLPRTWWEALKLRRSRPPQNPISRAGTGLARLVVLRVVAPRRLANPTSRLLAKQQLAGR